MLIRSSERKIHIIWGSEGTICKESRDFGFQNMEEAVLAEHANVCYRISSNSTMQWCSSASINILSFPVKGKWRPESCPLKLICRSTTVITMPVVGGPPPPRARPGGGGGGEDGRPQIWTPRRGRSALRLSCLSSRDNATADIIQPCRDHVFTKRTGAKISQLFKLSCIVRKRR